LKYYEFDNIRMDLREIRWEGVGRIHLAQDRDQWQAMVNMIMTSSVTFSFLKRTILNGVDWFVG
jgi:hypothetical protein